MQGDKTAPKVIGYLLKSFKGSQINWSTLVKEACAVYKACKHFSVFILGAPTILYCDRKPLANFLWNQMKNAMVNRWSLDIQEYALKFIWVNIHTNISDCLSWLVENDLYREHDKVEDDFPEGGMDKARQHVNDEVITEAKILKGYPILHAVPVRQQESVAVSTMEEFSTLGLTKLDRKQVAELQKKDPYIRRIVAEAGKHTNENGIFTKIDNIWYRVFEHGQKRKHHRRVPSYALLVLKSLVATVLVNTHLELLHLGQDKMLNVLQPRVY